MNLIFTESLLLEIALKLFNLETVKNCILNNSPPSFSHELTLGNGYPGLLILSSVLQSKGILDEKSNVCHQYVFKIKEVIETHGVQNLSLFSGLSGICFALQQASQGGERYMRMLNSMHDFLHSRIHEDYLKPLLFNIHNNQSRPSFHYDVITGISGIGRYALENLSDPRFLELSYEITKILVALCAPIEVNGIQLKGWYLPSTDCLNEQIKPLPAKGNFNLGLAHGVTGILAFLSIASLRGIKVDGQHNTMRQIANWIRSKSFVENEVIKWPCTVSWEEEVENKTEAREISKDAWCYGVPGIARTLFLAGKALEDDELKTFATDAFRGIFVRDRSNWNLPGPSLCHGIAGLLMITSAMAKEKECEDLSPRLIDLQKYLFELYNSSFSFGFKDIETHPEKTVQVCKIGLLEGTTGILLTLLTLSDPKPLWQLPFLIHE